MFITHRGIEIDILKKVEVNLIAKRQVLEIELDLSKWLFQLDNDLILLCFSK